MTSFYRAQVREWMRINPNNLRYYLSQLTGYGYLKVIHRHKYQGQEYQITDLREYQQLKGSLYGLLDQILDQLQAKYGPQKGGDSG
ncbi:MAG: hypothetical protein HC880_03895 [Bacteroidia bacterium]|nr:hypothetical protein [Bacteroidia bacterium]